MDLPFAEEQLAQLKMFIQVCKMKPQIIQHPKLSFFKEYLLSLGVTLPTATFEPSAESGTKSEPKKETNNASANNTSSAQAEVDEESEPESDMELDMEGVIESDTYNDQEMGDENKEVTDDDREKSDEKRSEAMRAFSEQQFDEAITAYTEAIKLNPQSALLFAKRGQVFLKQNKLHACIKDCTRALELNCDSAAAYKIRGRAYRLLGKFEEASLDLGESLKIDYDDQANEWLSEVKPNADKLRQHRLSVQRKKGEKEHLDKVRRARAAQEARETAAREQAAGGAPGGMPGMPGGMPGMPGGMPGMPGMAEAALDPEVLAAMEDPEVMSAFIDVSSNPSNFFKYQNNPKVMAALDVFKRKFYFSGAGAPPPAGAGAQKPPAADDVGLD